MNGATGVGRVISSCFTMPTSMLWVFSAIAKSTVMNIQLFCFPLNDTFTVLFPYIFGGAPLTVDTCRVLGVGLRRSCGLADTNYLNAPVLTRNSVSDLLPKMKKICRVFLPVQAVPVNGRGSIPSQVPLTKNHR